MLAERSASKYKVTSTLACIHGQVTNHTAKNEQYSVAYLISASYNIQNGGPKQHTPQRGAYNYWERESGKVHTLQYKELDLNKFWVNGWRVSPENSSVEIIYIITFKGHYGLHFKHLTDWPGCLHRNDNPFCVFLASQCQVMLSER